MRAHVMPVCFINQTMLDLKRMHHESVLMHMIIHVLLYTYYGSNLKLVTATTESSLNVVWKCWQRIYDQTSRQTNDFHKQFLTKYIMHEIHQQYSLFENSLKIQISLIVQVFQPDR